MAVDQDWRDAAAADLRAAHEADLEDFKAAKAVEQEARNRADEVLARMQKRVEAANALEIRLEENAPDAEPVTEDADDDTGSAMTAREIILEALSEAAPEPMKAAELRKVIEQRLGREIHYKTPGMTLYRLADDGLVRREGHRWFAVTDDQRDAEGQQTEKEFDL